MNFKIFFILVLSTFLNSLSYQFNTDQNSWRVYEKNTRGLNDSASRRGLAQNYSTFTWRAVWREIRSKNKQTKKLINQHRAMTCSFKTYMSYSTFCETEKEKCKMQEEIIDSYLLYFPH